MSDLVLAIPSKGRLMEATDALLAEAGLTIARDRGGRGYTAGIAGLGNVEVRLLSASEIAARLGSGEVHLGVTGEDLIREALPDADETVHLVTPLGFGHADVVVAAPAAWIDVETMADLEDVAARFHTRGHRMRVATKYVTLTRAFFARHGLRDYAIVESLGATEGAPAAGTAEVIVDITSSGATLVANGLKVLDDGLMLASQANLVASLTADWSGEARAAVSDILMRLAARRLARETVILKADIAASDEVVAKLDEVFGASAPYGTQRPLLLHAPEDKGPAIAMALRAAGAGTVTVTRPDAIFAPKVAMLDGLMKRLG